MKSHSQPEFFMPDERVRMFKLAQSIDLPAADVPKYGPKFIVFDFVVPKGQVFVVKGMVFPAWKRIEVGATDEDYQLLTNQEIAGHVAFEPIVDGQSPFQIDSKLSTVNPLATAQNAIKQRNAGFTNVTEDPDNDLMSQWWNPLYTFPVHAGKRLEVLFSIVDTGAGVTPWQVTTDSSIERRIDFAGAIVVGQVLSESDFGAFRSTGDLGGKK